MNGWLPELPEELPENIKPKAGMAERIVSGVKAREIRRKRLVREAWGGFAAVAAVAVVAVLVMPAWNQIAGGNASSVGAALRGRPAQAAGRGPGPKGNPSAPSGFASGTRNECPSPTATIDAAAQIAGRGQSPSPTGAIPAIAPPLVLSKVDHSVEVRWQGDKNGEYVVYRCTSPTFDQCSLADKVKGTKWVDASDEPGIIYYRVEPSTGNGRRNNG